MSVDKGVIQMGNLLTAAQPVLAAGKRWLNRRRSESGVAGSTSHIGWAIGAIVIVGGLLAALHSVWLPWMTNLFSNVTSISTTTTTTP